MRLRVVRAYQVPAFGNGNEVSSYEVIFHDKENQRIHATIKAHAMKNLSTIPVEGRLYAVKDFLVAENRMKFRTTTTTMKIIFLRKTRIEEVFDETFPKSMFIFKSFKYFEALKDTPQFDLFGNILYFIVYLYLMFCLNTIFKFLIQNFYTYLDFLLQM